MMWRRPFPGFLIALAAMLAISSGVSGQQEKGPIASPVEPVKDVGQVSRGEQITHSFAIRNDGDQPLVLTEVQPACGCTVVEYDERIEPGATGKVKAVMETENFRGPIAKSISVYTNDSGNARILMVLKADIRSHLESSPSYARFLTVRGEGAEKTVLTVSSTDYEGLRIERVESPWGFLATDYRLATEDEGRSDAMGDQWMVELTLAADAPVGPLADRVRIHTNHPRVKVLAVPVSGFVRPILGVSPPVADFGSRRLDGPFESNLELRNFSQDDIEVRSVETDLSAVTAELESVEDGRRYQLRLTLSPNAPKGNFQGLLTIRTSSPDQPVLEVVVKGKVL